LRLDLSEAAGRHRSTVVWSRRVAGGAKERKIKLIKKYQNIEK